MKAEIRPRIELRNRIPLRELVPLEVPLIIFVDPSDVCNFHCKFCPTGDIKLMKDVGRPLKTMDFELYKKIIDDICEFEGSIKVLRLYKDGEPLMNPRFPDMVRYAKESGCCEKVDTTTNASLLSPKRNLDIIEAGLDRINISIEGVREEQYKKFSGIKINFDKLVWNIKHFYDNRGDCEMFIKINGDVISEEDKETFYEIFGDITDGIFIEHVMNCWNEFDMSIKENKEFGIYGQEINKIEVCPYLFYGFSINSDGTASLCFLDWNRKLQIGDIKKESVKEIWHGKKLKDYRIMFLEGRRKSHKICGNCSQLSHGMPENIDDCREKLLRFYK